MKALITFFLGCFAAAWAQQATLAERDAHYRLQPEDKIEVQYRFTPEFNGGASIQPDGFASLPLVGELKLAGLTLEEASTAIRKKANERLNDPEVIVLLRDYVKPYFVAAGEVARPGRVEMRGNVSLIEAIALSGGFKDSARRTQVIMFRKSPSGDTAEVKLYDVRKLMSASGVGEDVLVRPGDMLVVPRNNYSKVEPYIRIAEAGFYALAQRFL